MRTKYNSIKNNSKKRNIPFELSFEEFSFLKTGSCHYCGVDHVFISFYCKMLNINTPFITIDRKDNLKHYFIENCVTACFLCNKIKGNFFSYEEMVEIGKNYVSPKLEKFKKEVIENYQEWCENNILLPEEEYF